MDGDAAMVAAPAKRKTAARASTRAKAAPKAAVAAGSPAKSKTKKSSKPRNTTASKRAARSKSSKAAKAKKQKKASTAGEKKKKSKKTKASAPASSAPKRARASAAASKAVDELDELSSDGEFIVDDVAGAEVHESPRDSRKRPRETDDEPNVSAARKTRVYEKKELQNLNQRLQAYILFQKEREKNLSNTQRALDDQKDTLESDMEATREAYQQQLDAVRQQRDTHAIGQKEFEKRTADLEKELAAASKSLEYAKQANADQADELQGARDEADELTVRLRDAEDQLKKVSAQSKALQVELARTTSERDELQDENDTLRESTSAEDADLQRSSEEMQLLVNKAVAEKEVLERKLTESRAKLAKAERAMQHGFDDHFADLLKQKQEEWNREKDDIIRELKSVYEARCEAYKAQLAQAGHDRAVLEEQVASLEAEVDEAVSRAERIAAERDDFGDKVKLLEAQLAAARERPSKDLAEKVRLIKQMKMAYQRKEKEFDDLMDVKIALAVEIKAYRILLEQEETRLGYGSASAESARKKRRLNDGSAADSDSTGSGSSSAPMATDGEARLVLSGSLGGKFLTVRNQSTENVRLEGWMLRNGAGTHTFGLPDDVELGPAALIKIWIGQPDEDVDEDITEDDVVWDADNLWDVENGDEAELIDPEGVVVHSYVVVPGARADPNKSCIVM